MFGTLLKFIICSVGALVFAPALIACDEQASYVIYEVPARPCHVRSSTETSYSSTVEYRQVTQYYRTTNYEVTRSYSPERPMRNIRYAYIDP